MLLLNHQHLYYFWVTAREGSVMRASKLLLLAQPTISSQIIQLEKSLGKSLFRREKNRLTLTDEGREVRGYADEIFGTTQDLLEALKNGTSLRERHVRVGIDTHVTREVTRQFIKAIYAREPNAHLTLQEGIMRELLRQLRAHELDILLTEEPLPGGDTSGTVKKEACRLSIFFVAAPRFARQVKHFPDDLENIPFLLPPAESSLAGSIERFFVRHDIRPRVMGHIQHADLMHQLALDGRGAAPLHEISCAEQLRAGKLVRLGRRTTGITKTLWLLTRAQRRPHPVIDHLWKTFHIG